MKSQRLNPSQVARAAKSLRVVLTLIEHTPEVVRAEKVDSIERAYKFLDAPADNQKRGKELVAALQWSLDFIMKHTEGRASPELTDAFAILRSYVADKLSDHTSPASWGGTPRGAANAVNAGKRRRAPLRFAPSGDRVRSPLMLAAHFSIMAL
jgi:hypothetical protein